MQTSAAGRLPSVVQLKVISILAVSDAVRKGDANACMWLIRKGVDLNQRYSMFLWSALIEAAILNKIVLIPILLKGGAGIDQRDVDGRTALMWASKSGNAESVEILLRKGASPLLKDESGSTALSFAKDPRIKDMICKRIREMKKKPR